MCQRGGEGFLFAQRSVGTTSASFSASCAWPWRVRCMKSIWLNSHPSASRKCTWLRAAIIWNCAATAGLLHAAVTHDFVVETLLDAGRCHDEDVGLLAAPAVHALALLDQPLHADADAGGVGTKALLDVVRAQHDDEQVDDLMALQQGIRDAQSVHGFVDGVYENGRPAGQALFRDEVLAAQCGLQTTGPALVLVEADAAVGVVLRVGAIAVGVGVAKAENEFSSQMHSFLSYRSGWLWRK